MLDLIFNESFVRASIHWGAAATPLAGLIVYLAGRRGNPAACEEAGGASSACKADSSPLDAPGQAPSGAPVRPAGRAGRQCRCGALALGLIGPSIWALWMIYEAIMNLFGFASVAGLLICLAIFLALGSAAGWVWGRCAAK